MAAIEASTGSPIVGAAVDARIRAEPIVWLTTMAPTGRPCVVPTWFSWDGRAFRIFTKPTARKLRNVACNPHVMLALGNPHADFDVMLIEASAFAEAPAMALASVDGHLARYRAALSAIGLDRDEYVRTYSATMRIEPTRLLGWSGRSHLPQAAGSDRIGQAHLVG